MVEVAPDDGLGSCYQPLRNIKSYFSRPYVVKSLTHLLLSAGPELVMRKWMKGALPCATFTLPRFVRRPQYKTRTELLVFINTSRWILFAVHFSSKHLVLLFVKFVVL